MADLIGQKLGDYVITESGFGSDMGMEKFFDIVCRKGGIAPSAVVLVATVRALKHHGGIEDDPRVDGARPGPRSRRASPTCAGTSGIVKTFGLPCVVAVNRRPGDTDEEVELVRTLALEAGAFGAEINEGFARGGEGAAALAEAVAEAAEQPNEFAFTYDDEDSIEEKIRKVAQQGLRRQGRGLLPRRPAQDAPVPRRRPRQAAHLHGQDAPVAVGRSRRC